MSEYRDEKNNLFRITQVSPMEDDNEVREEREQQIVEELYAIFEKRK